LLELIIALAIFAIGVLGLARSLNASMEVANILNKDQRVRIGMRSFLEEIRRKPLNEMSVSTTDALLGVTYTSLAEPVALTMTRGNTMQDMYNLKIIASYAVGSEQREESVDVYVYKPAQ
jgi:Tfp pilus assembly protein PilV